MPHLKAFGMMNLHYEIRICQKISNRVTTQNKSICLVQNSLHQTLSGRQALHQDYLFDAVLTERA